MCVKVNRIFSMVEKVTLLIIYYVCAPIYGLFHSFTSFNLICCNKLSFFNSMHSYVYIIHLFMLVSLINQIVGKCISWALLYAPRLDSQRESIDVIFVCLAICICEQKQKHRPEHDSVMKWHFAAFSVSWLCNKDFSLLLSTALFHRLLHIQLPYPDRNGWKKRHTAGFYVFCTFRIQITAQNEYSTKTHWRSWLTSAQTHTQAVSNQFDVLKITQNPSGCKDKPKKIVNWMMRMNGKCCSGRGEWENRKIEYRQKWEPKRVRNK